MPDRFWHADLAQGDLGLRLGELVRHVWSDNSPVFRFIERNDNVTLDQPDGAQASDLGNLDDCVRLRCFGPTGDVHARRLTWEGGGAWRVRVATGVDLGGLPWLLRFESDAIAVAEKTVRYALFGRRLGDIGWYEGKLPRAITYPMAKDDYRVVLEALQCCDDVGRTTDWRFVRLLGMPREGG